MTSGLMRIGEVAERTGTTPRTIRYYEEIGLLGCAADREQGKHRCYTEDDIEQIQRIVQLRDLLGLPLEQLARVVEAENAHESILRKYNETDDPVRQRELMECALEHVETQIQLVAERQRQLRALERDLAARRSALAAKLAAAVAEPVAES